MAGNENVVRVLSESSMRDENGVMRTLSEQKIPYGQIPYDKVPVHVKIELGLEKFESLSPGGKYWSGGVSSVLAPRAVWMLQVLPRWGPSNIAVYLHLTGPTAAAKKTLMASYHIYLGGGAVGGIDSVERSTFEFGSGGDFSKCFGISLDRVKKALQKDGSLVVAAEVEFLTPCDGDAETIGENELHAKWHGTFGKLLKSGDYSDCSLMVDGEELKAHRLVLSAISPVFGKILEEAKDGVVHIDDKGMLKDTSAKPFQYRALLSYFYTGRVNWALFGECKRDVLLLACKYRVDDLKHHVEQQLADEITAESFTELALLADRYSYKRLKKACVRYLSAHCLAVVLTPQWGVLMREKGAAAEELLRLVREGKIDADEDLAIR